GEGIGERLPVIEGVDGGVGIIQGVGVAAVGLESQGAVTEVEGAGIGDAQRVAIGILIIGESVADDRVRSRVLLDRGRISNCSRRGVGWGVGGALNSDGQRGAAGAAVGVADLVGEGIGERLPVIEGVHGGGGVIQGVGVAAVGLESQGAVTEVEGAGIGDAQRVAIGILIVGENVADDRVRSRVFLDRGRI